MSEAKWYPTAVTLGDRRVLVVGGDNTRQGFMDVYDETTDSFSEVTGDDRPFPNTYPSLHLLPNHAIFYGRTGWGTAGPGGFATVDNQSAYFTLSGNSGSWNNIAPSGANRAKGMSVMLLSNTPPYVKVMVLGGVDNATNNTYQTIDVSTLSPSTAWSADLPFPDGEHRSLCSGVILPDGNVFVSGGIQRTNSPCAMYNLNTNSWSGMANLPSQRDYHSVALLLPSGKVMMAGWNNTKIEIYSPPYLFKGPKTCYFRSTGSSASWSGICYRVT